MQALADVLGGFGTAVFRWALLAFVILNAAAVVTVLVTRSRHVVNRWTGRFLAANLLLLGVGAGAPLLAQGLKLVVQAVSAAQHTDIQLKGK